MEKRGKSFDGLMRHIRNSHNIEIRGSEDKKRLVNIGYYHGYKGYKFIIKMLLIRSLEFIILNRSLLSLILISK